MNILDKILLQKQKEIKLNREKVSIKDLTKMSLFESETVSFSQSIKNGSGIIAEFKRKSPSAGEIHNNKIEDVLQKYENHNVSAFSILTDKEFFGGGLNDLEKAKRCVSKPLLRKDFIIDEYQLFEAKAYGADAVLLIAEALDAYHATSLITVAHSIGLEVLMEFHSLDEIKKLNEDVDVVGINNRNLKTLETSINTSEQLFNYLPHDKVKISESGIQEVVQLELLYKKGFDGALIGESVLKNSTLLAELSKAASASKFVTYEA